VSYAEVNGTRLYYERHGHGEPVLLITGFALSAAVFEPVLDRYTDRFECLLYDNRGAGRSDAPLHPTSMPELAADAAELIRALGCDSAHVYGVSMGGMVAQELAISFPERVRGLVLAATTPGGPRALWPSVREWGALGGRVARDRSLSGALFSERFRREQPDRVRELLRSFARHRATARGAWWHWWAVAYHDSVSRLGEIQAPTLVLHGGEDALTPLGNAKLLAQRIPDAELVVIPGAGHAFPLEQPQASADALFEWVQRRSPIEPGRPRDPFAARAERFTRPFGLPVGAMRAGASLVERALRR
jgi:3-oxoadipate enol-lactonase